MIFQYELERMVETYKVLDRLKSIEGYTQLSQEVSF